MSLFRREPRAFVPRNDLVDELRSAKRMLKGWTMYGTDSPDLWDLLSEAASEIESLTRARRNESGGLND